VSDLFRILRESTDEAFAFVLNI